jgi:hypothetical protein
MPMGVIFRSAFTTVRAGLHIMPAFLGSRRRSQPGGGFFDGDVSQTKLASSGAPLRQRATHFVRLTIPFYRRSDLT